MSTGASDGEHVRKRRNALGLTQQQLAHEAGVSESGLRAIEGSKRAKPYRLRDILRALDRIEQERRLGEVADWAINGGEPPPRRPSPRPPVTRKGDSDESASQGA